MDAMRSALTRFLQYLRVERNASDLTIKSYREDLTALAGYLTEAAGDCPAPDGVTVLDYRRDGDVQILPLFLTEGRIEELPASRADIEHDLVTEIVKTGKVLAELGVIGGHAIPLSPGCAPRLLRRTLPPKTP